MSVRRPATLSAAVIPLLLLLATPAAADDSLVDSEMPVRPQMAVTIRYPTPGTHEVCWAGRLRGLIPAPAPTWRVAVAGGRSDGSAISAGPWVWTGLTVSGCFTVTKNSADRGDYVVVFSYYGVGGADVPSALAGTGLWTGSQNNKVETAQ